MFDQKFTVEGNNCKATSWNEVIFFLQNNKTLSAEENIALTAHLSKLFSLFYFYSKL